MGDKLGQHRHQAIRLIAVAEEELDTAVARADPEATTAEALETAVEGVAPALSITPGSIVPTLGGELVVAEETPGEAPAVVTSDSVRAGLRQAGPLALAGLAANGANVIVTVLMARLLTTRGYGALAQLTGIFLIVSMPGSALIVGVVRRVTAWKGQGSAERVWRWARRVHRYGTVAAVAFVLVAFLARGWLAGQLSLPGTLGVVGILAAGATWVLLSLDRGLLQAHRDYRTLSFNLLVEGGARTVGMLALVGAGFGVTGAAWGMFAGELVTAVHARIVADRVWSNAARRERRARAGLMGNGRGAVAQEETAAGVAALAGVAPGAVGSPEDARSGAAQADAADDGRHRRQLLIDLAVALVAMALLALLQNVDVIVLGREAPHASGSYAAISVASKALVFGAIALGGYLLPEAAIRWRQGGHALRQLTVTLLLLSVPALALLVIAVAFPHLLLSVVFSSRYLGAQKAFVWLVLAMVFLCITVILTMYLLAIGERWVSAVLFVGAAAATGAVILAHGAPRSTAVADLVVQMVLAGVLTASFAVVHKRRLRVPGLRVAAPTG